MRNFSVHFFEIWLVVNTMSFKIFLFLALERNQLCYFGIGHYGEIFCVIFYTKFEPVVQELLFINVSNFSSGGHFAQWGRTFDEILVEGIKGNIQAKLFSIGISGSGRDVI